MLVTFLVTLRDEAGSVLTVLEPVRVTEEGPSSDEGADRQCFAEALNQPGGNAPLEVLKRLFGGWWEEGREQAKEEARRRAERYKRQEESWRRERKRRMEEEWRSWVEASEREILGDYWREYQQLRLFEEELRRRIPAQIWGRLERFRRRAEEVRSHWEKWTHLLEPAVEEVGLLLRVPQNAILP